MSVTNYRKRWAVDVRWAGKRYRKNSPVNSKAGAKAYEAYILQQFSIGNDPFDKEEKKEVLTFEKFAWKWVEIYVKNNNKISGVRGKSSILKTHLIPFLGKKRLDQITSLHIEEYKALTRNKGLCNKTINSHLTVLNTCLTYAVEWEEIKTRPKIKRLKVPPQKYDFLTFTESQMLIGKAHGIWKEMLLFALYTGMRYGEIRAIDWSDINWEKNLITVKKAFYRDILGFTKSEKERHIPIFPRLRSVLESRKKRKGFVFADKNGKFLDENLPRRALYRITDKTELSRANGRRIGWHALRHTFASQLAMRGAPLPAIQQLLGHSSIHTTMRYAHLSPSTLDKTIMLLESDNNKNFGHYMVTSQPERQEVRRVFNSLNL